MISAIPVEVAGSDLAADIADGLVGVEKVLAEAANAEEPLLTEASRHLIDAGVAGIAEVRGEQDQGGAEPFPASIDEMPGGLGEQRLLGIGGLGQHLLDTNQAIGDVGGQVGIGKFNGDGTDH